MSKRLILILVLAFVVGFAFSAYAEVQNVKVSGDMTQLGFTRTGFTLTSPADTGKVEAQGLAMIVNLKVNADLTDAVTATVMLRNERIWGLTRNIGTSGAGENSNLDTYLSAAWVTLKDFIQPGWTFKLGQQAVKLGSGLIWGDPNTNQSGSGPFNYELADMDPRIAFAGAIASMDYSPLVITTGALKITDGSSLLTNKDDVNTYLLQAGYDLKDILNMKSMAEAYYVLEDANKAIASPTTGLGEVSNYGIRTVLSPSDTTNLSGELAYQARKGFRSDKKTASAAALLLAANMSFPDVTMKPVLGVDYSRIGDNWETMYESLSPADIANALFPNTNCQTIGATVGVKPMDDLGVKLRYANLTLVQKITGTQTLNSWGSYIFQEKADLGNEVDLNLTYDYTEDVQFGLKAGYFKPGKALTEDYRKTATQVIGSMKVTF